MTNQEDVHFENACKMMNIGDFKQAISEFSQAIEIKPSGAAYENRAIAKSMIKDYKGAINDFALSIITTEKLFGNPNFSKDLINRDICVTYINKVKTQLELGDYGAAVIDTEKTLDIYKNVNLWQLPPTYHIGCILSNGAIANFQTNNFTKALDYATHAELLNPDVAVKKLMKDIIKESNQGLNSNNE